MAVDERQSKENKGYGRRRIKEPGIGRNGVSSIRYLSCQLAGDGVRFRNRVGDSGHGLRAEVHRPHVWGPERAPSLLRFANSSPMH